MADNDIRYSRIPKDVAERWKVVRDVCAGDQALRCDAYLPPLNATDQSPQNIARNRAYRDRAVLYTATGFTLAGMIGLAFRHDPKSDLPSVLEYLLKDADGAGVSIYQQSQSVLGSNVQIGRHGLYVDFSSELKRPLIKSYRAENVINWRESLVGGKTVLSMVVLREDAEKDDGYKIVPIDQWRELFLNEQGLCTVRLWQLDDEAEPQIVQIEDADGNMVDEVVLRSSGAPLDFIPFEFIGSQNNDSSIDDSPLYGIAKINVAHFRNSADYEDAAFYHGQSQAWMSGLTEEWRDHLEKSGSMYIGSRAPILLPVGGAFGFEQAGPNMVAMEAMTHKEAQMLALGARLIEKGGAVKTATQSEGEREASTSVLAMCTANVSEAYQTAIDWCARYLDLKPAADATTYQINQEFTEVANDPLTITALVGAWQAGIMAKTDVRAYFRRQGTIATERTDEAIDADLVLDPPVDPNAKPGVDANGKPLDGAQPQDASAKPAEAAPAADFGPLIASMESLISALGKAPEPPEPAAPIDFAPLIAAMPQPMDLTPLAEAMKAQAVAIRAMPAPIVNYQAGDVTMAPPAITFEPGSIAVTPAPINVEGPTVNLPQAPQPAAAEPWREIEFIEDANGVITGARKV